MLTGVSIPGCWRFTTASCSTCMLCHFISKTLQLGLRLLPQGGADTVCLWQQAGHIATSTAQQGVSNGLLFMQETWEAMEAIHAKGLARNIGVSNWSIKKTQDMLKYAKVVPAVNQVRAPCRGAWHGTVPHTQQGGTMELSMCAHALGQVSSRTTGGSRSRSDLVSIFKHACGPRWPSRRR